MEGVKREIYEDKWKMEQDSKQKTGCSKFFDRRWISLAILVFVNLINYADRYSLSAVLGVSLSPIVHLKALIRAWKGLHCMTRCVSSAPRDALWGPCLQCHMGLFEPFFIRYFSGCSRWTLWRPKVWHFWDGIHSYSLHHLLLCGNWNQSITDLIQIF